MRSETDPETQEGPQSSVADHDCRRRASGQRRRADTECRTERKQAGANPSAQRTHRENCPAAGRRQRSEPTYALPGHSCHRLMPQRRSQSCLSRAPPAHERPLRHHAPPQAALARMTRIVRRRAPASEPHAPLVMGRVAALGAERPWCAVDARPLNVGGPGRAQAPSSGTVRVTFATKPAACNRCAGRGP